MTAEGGDAPFGRVDAEGNVFVRTADGERKVGSWQAGSPDEALAWGLVNRVVPSGGELHGAITLAKEIAANAPLAVGLAKLIVDQGDGLPKHSQMSIERWAQSQLITTGASSPPARFG